MLTPQLAQFVHRTRWSDIPAAVVVQAKMHLLDTIGVALAGSQHQLGRIMADHVRALGGNATASVIGHGFKTSAPLAALANGTMANVLDLDDDSDTIYGHPSTTLLPAVMALGESGCSGKDLLLAYILGEEVAARVAQVPGFLPCHYQRGWHATATLGVIGAAAAAAKITGLDIGAICHTLGLAASDAGGLKANFGSMAKPIHAGSTAAKAVSAALLAGAGVTANPRILESPDGFLELFGGNREADFSKPLKALGKRWDFLTPGVNIKLYPSCYYTHCAIDLLLDMMRTEKIAHTEIESIYCAISPLAEKVLFDALPSDGFGCRFYLPYCLAVAALHETVEIVHFNDDTLILQPEMQRLMDNVNTVVNPELGDDGLGLGARLVVTTTRKGTLSMSKSKPRGSGSQPLPWNQIIDKYRSCTRGILNRRNQDAIAAQVRELDKLESIHTLTNAICQTKG